MVIMLLATGCAPHDPRADAVSQSAGDPSRGQQLYRTSCEQCHIPAHEQNLAQAVAWFGPVGTISIIIDGVPGSKMPSFRTFTDLQVADLYAYMRTLKK